MECGLVLLLESCCGGMLGKDPGFIDGNPAFQLVGLGFPLKVNFQGGVKPGQSLGGSAMGFKVVKGTNTVLGRGQASCSASFSIMSMESLVSCDPFFVAVGPNNVNKGSDPIWAMVVGGGCDAIGSEIVVLLRRPLGGPSTKQELAPANAGLLCNKGIKARGR